MIKDLNSRITTKSGIQEAQSHVKDLDMDFKRISKEMCRMQIHHKLALIHKQCRERIANLMDEATVRCTQAVVEDSGSSLEIQTKTFLEIANDITVSCITHVGYQCQELT